MTTWGTEIALKAKVKKNKSSARVSVVESKENKSAEQRSSMFTSVYSPHILKGGKCNGEFAREGLNCSQNFLINNFKNLYKKFHIVNNIQEIKETRNLVFFIELINLKNL